MTVGEAELCATIITLRTNGERGDRCSFMEDPVGSGPRDGA